MTYLNTMFYAWFKWQSIVNLIIDSDKPLDNIGETHASAVSRAIECGIPQRLKEYSTLEIL